MPQSCSTLEALTFWDISEFQPNTWYLSAGASARVRDTALAFILSRLPDAGVPDKVKPAESTWAYRPNAARLLRNAQMWGPDTRKKLRKTSKYYSLPYPVHGVNVIRQIVDGIQGLRQQLVRGVKVPQISA